MFVALMGDECGGKIIATGVSVLIEGRPVALVGDEVTPHGKPPHHKAYLKDGTTMLLIQGRPVSRIGDAATCDHRVTQGAASVLANA